MSLSIDHIDFECPAVDSSQWPRLGCGGGALLKLTGSNLLLEADRAITFADNGQVRSFDDNHKLVFNRTGNLLELHEAGDIRFLTGVPTPTERLRIRADGKVGIGTDAPEAKLHVAGDIHADGPLRVTGVVDIVGGLTVTNDVNFSSNLQVHGLQVNGQIDATEIRQNGLPLRLSQWQDGDNSISYSGGNVGIGTEQPQQVLDIYTPGNSGSHILAGGHTLTLKGVNDPATYFAALPYIQWLEGNGLRAMYLGWGSTNTPKRVDLGLENGYSLNITGGPVRINHDLDVMGRINGQLGGLDVAPTFQARVRCADFIIGGVGDRGPERRALVAWAHALEINHNGDWPAVIIQNVGNGSSRERKANIAQLTLAAAHEVLHTLNPVEYTVKTDPGQKIRSGFIAEESPSLVATSDHKAIFVDGIVAVLTKIVQQQDIEIAALKADIKALTGTLPMIENN